MLQFILLSRLGQLRPIRIGQKDSLIILKKIKLYLKNHHIISYGTDFGWYNNYVTDLKL